MSENESKLLPSRAKGTTSIQLVVAGLLAALVAVMAVPAFDGLFNFAGQVLNSQD